MSLYIDIDTYCINIYREIINCISIPIDDFKENI